MKRLLTTLEQWRSAEAVVHEGGYAQAAMALNKSQSSVSHAVRELSDRLGVEIFQVVGRKAELTAAGETLMRRGNRLLDDAQELENTAAALAKGLDVELGIAVDVIAPNNLVIDALNRFAKVAPVTRVAVHETVLSGTEEALIGGQVDLGISAFTPLGFVGVPLLTVEFLAVAAADHALHQIDRDLDFDDLRQYRQLVVRDSGRGDKDAGWLEAHQRWTFSSSASSLEALRAGSGFAWIPVHKITRELADGSLRPLRLKNGGRRTIMVQIIMSPAITEGTGARALADAFLAAAADLPDLTIEGITIK